MASGDGMDAIEVAASESMMLRDLPGGDELKERAAAAAEGKPESGVSQIGRSVGSRNRSDKDRKIGHRRVGVGGEITYKKIQTTQIMGSIQLGIQHAVGSLASKPERDLLMQDFMTLESTNFPHEGSNHTPAHHFSEFRFKNYAPIAFRYFRDLFGIQPDDYLMSMCSAPLRELSNPGASGSIFYLTEDDEFIIKTVQHKEGEFLQKLLPGYYMNLNQNPRTLLPKFFGLYCYQCNSKNVRLVAMNNLLPSSITLHLKYDLKGSTYKRKASKSERNKKSPTFKDLDFMEQHPEGLLLEADTYNALVKTIQRDCRVLESFKIMDYSLLLAIHNLDLAQKERAEEVKTQVVNPRGDESDMDDMPENPDNFVSREREREGLNRSKSINRQRLVAHSTAMESIQAECEPIYEEEDVPPGGIPATSARGERLLLFVGIIDILQSYRLKKKLEHTWKSLIHDGDTVSVHRPGFYAQRFQDFMAKTVFKKMQVPLKHSPSKRKSITRAPRSSDGDNEMHDPKRQWHTNNRAGTSYPKGKPSNAPSCSSSSSTPPPAFDDVMHSGHGGHSGDVSSSGQSHMSEVESRDGNGKRTHHVTVTRSSYRDEGVSTSEVRLDTRSNLSVDIAGRGHNWTPPASTPRGSTPTWTEGTPSFTESSSSGDGGFPSSPLRGEIVQPSMEDALNSLTNEMTVTLSQMVTIRHLMADDISSNEQHSYTTSQLMIQQKKTTF